MPGRRRAPPSNIPSRAKRPFAEAIKALDTPDYAEAATGSRRLSAVQ